jgi:DNA-directed RNA polymerase subunit RPC12/RpoP
VTVYEVLTIALIVVLAAASTAAIYLGLRGWAGDLYVVRCASCNHLTFASADQPPHSCPYCRHGVLLHPMHAIHNADEVRGHPTAPAVARSGGVATLQDASR